MELPSLIQFVKTSIEMFLQEKSRHHRKGAPSLTSQSNFTLMKANKHDDSILNDSPDRTQITRQYEEQLQKLESDIRNHISCE